MTFIIGFLATDAKIVNNTRNKGFKTYEKNNNNKTLTSHITVKKIPDRRCFLKSFLTALIYSLLAVSHFSFHILEAIKLVFLARENNTGDLAGHGGMRFLREQSEHLFHTELKLNWCMIRHLK